MGAALIAVRPAVSPWYFADFRLDRSVDDTVEAAYAAARANKTVTRARDVETTGFASSEIEHYRRGMPADLIRGRDRFAGENATNPG